MSTKFEQLLDYLVNEEMDKANELFHEIVVEKSREIYENLIAEEEDQQDEAKDQEDESVEEADEQEDESVEEADEQEDESVEESEMDLEDSYELEGGEVGGDSTDSLLDKVSPDDDADMDMSPEMDDSEASEDDAILDIKNAIEELEAAFAQLQQAQGDEDGMSGDEEGPEMPTADDEDEEETEEMMGRGMFEGKKRMTREYVEKVGSDWEKGSTQKSQGQYAGAGTGDKEGAPVEGKSPISSGKGKPTTGATAHNILGDKKAGHGTNTGTSPAKPDMGVVKSGGKFTGSGTHNVDGVKSGVKTLSKVTDGHGPEKKGSGPGPVGAGTGDKAGQTSVGVVKSPINGAPNRNA